MGRIYLPFEDPNRGMVPTFGPVLPGTPHPTIVGNPHLRSGPFVALPGYGMEAAEAVTNMMVDPDFPDLTNWVAWNTPTTREVGAQFAMDQGEFFGGLHIIGDAVSDGARGDNVNVGTETDYVGSAWIYTISGQMGVDFYESGGTPASHKISSTELNKWVRREIAFTTLGAATTITPYCGTLVGAGAGEGYFWMPQFETGTYAKPARVGAQPASCIYVPSPISETQTPWSIACVLTPDWDYTDGSNWGRVWTLYEDSNNILYLYYRSDMDKWTLQTKATSSAEIYSAVSAHSRGDKIQLVVTSDGYNAYLYTNGIQTGPLVIKSAQPTNLIIGAGTTAAGNAFNGVVDDFAVIEGAAIPEFRVQELYRASLRGVPLHGVLESLS